MKKILCSRCKVEKGKSEFHKNNSSKRGVQSYCIQCKSEVNKELNNLNKGTWIYYITIDECIRWVGSTTNLKNRINKHKNGKKVGSLIYEAKYRGIDYKNKSIKVYACDIKKMGLNLNKKDLEYYEHILIRRLKVKNNDLFNKRVTAVFEERERYIDEVPIEKFKYKFYTEIYIK